MPRQMPRYGLPAAICFLDDVDEAEAPQVLHALAEGAYARQHDGPAPPVMVFARSLSMMGAPRRLKAFVTLLRFPIP